MIHPAEPWDSGTLLPWLGIWISYVPVWCFDDGGYKEKESLGHFLVGVLEHFFVFAYIGNNHPNWLSFFSEGLKPPTSFSSIAKLSTLQSTRWNEVTKDEQHVLNCRFFLGSFAPQGTQRPWRWGLQTTCGHLWPFQPRCLRGQLEWLQHLGTGTLLGEFARLGRLEEHFFMG